ncbi:glycoside hydrolase family 20 zincin-like fold domain-containing protein, partial [Vibrio parahaemolyticus]|uniref:glycoside hydrolase family 20 zincin-like fold domain-containing protein n=1 Tax=Vibrio parahaemolyticus TaxID=670 RepID=UPI001E53A073
PNAEPKMIASLNTEDVASFVTGLEGNNLKRTPDDNNIFASAVSRFEKNDDLVKRDVSTTLLPTPMHVEAGKGKVDITEGIALPKDVFDAAQFAAIQDRAEVVGVDVRGDLPVSITVVPADFTGELAKSGAYEMSINGDGIAIKAFDKVGAFYAVQSIFGLVDSQNADSLPQLSIQDAPRFDYRSVMVDVAR